LIFITEVIDVIDLRNATTNKHATLKKSCL
jgi:hypothetical protein